MMSNDNVTTNRQESLYHIAIELEKLVRSYGRRKDILITFSKLTDEIVKEFNPWDCERFILTPGEEYFFVWETERPDVADPYGLLYVVCITGDSLLTAAHELMELISRKF